MFVSITSTPLPYAWGSLTAIAELLGRPAGGGPEAELWFGSHPAAPSSVTGSEVDARPGSVTAPAWHPAAAAGNPAVAGGSEDLAEWLTRMGLEALPFLLKVLAAAAPLSLQVHPSAQHARAGFERENALGIPLDAPHRNYRDPFPKPELIVAVEPLRVLCGFRPVDEVRADLQRLLDLGAGQPVHEWLDRLREDSDLPGVFEWLITGGPGVAELVSAVVGAGREAVPVVGLLADAHPGDPGIAIALLLHELTLEQGEALYLPAGNVHAYLSGTGIELMTSSDNVLRGGLTAKHVDVAEVLAVADLTTGPAPLLAAQHLAPGVTQWHPAPEPFRLLRVEVPAVPALATDAVPAQAEPAPAVVPASTVDLAGPALLLCVSGEATVTGALGSITLPRGAAAYASPDEGRLTLTAHDGSATTVFVATTAP